jgi:outer membrane protein OmpA-like peptidoglycan-associated protein
MLSLRSRTRHQPTRPQSRAGLAAKSCRRAGFTLFSWLGIGVCGLAGVQAQQTDLHGFVPPAAPALGVTIPEPVPAPHGTLHVGLAFDYERGVLDRKVGCAPGSSDAACRNGLAAASARVPELGAGALLVDLALFDVLALSVALPLSLDRAELNGGSSQIHGGLGDIHFGVRGAFVASGAMRVGYSLDLSLPSAAADTFAGDPAATLTPSVIASQALGRLTLGAQVGYRLRRRQVLWGVESDDELALALAGRYALIPQLAVVAELRAALGIGGRSFRRAEAPAEIDLGLQVGSASGWRLDLGVGSGAWPGEGGMGAPDFRGFLVLRRAIGTSTCTTGPEDHDGFADADGCGDPDNDRDGVPDALDVCPNDPEDRDGFADADGCPDLDNDADGVPDARDLCPNDSEDRDGFQDEDGCPEPDNDADGIADGVDRCRLDPEDHDGYDDEDGCPEPGPGRPTVTLAGARLLMSDRIYFDDDADTLHPLSLPTLDVMAAAIKALPGHARVRVEGNTDDSGDAQANIDLSYRRARAVVEYLKAQGVPSSQLEYVGRGASQPLAPNLTVEGRALNRRVEFVVIGR